MRKSILIALAFIAASCSAISQKNNGDKRERIEGSGNVITKDIAVKSFDQLTSNGVFSLQLSQGDKETVKIEGEDNLIELITVQNDGSTLEISMKKDVDIHTKKKMTVYVTFKNLKSMNLGMVGGTSSTEQLKFTELKVKNQSVGSVNLDLALQTLNLENQSVGSLKLKGTAENAVIKSNSVGSIQAGDFVVQKMEVDNSGVGSATVNAEKELKVSDSFLGKVSNKGNTSPKKRVRS